ncbi:NUDIX domain-containing protein [Paenibacillus sp. HWE-109]|uniref:NUDIX hydrolase n=1 Tax=Paenibacillus sp. HWE-109 TaxID=1306526 RepID=UPI001EE1169D|nr:NUDIX domain-containing protein [Paenibacillus sp. HWE-109]UKS29127.1 NUDIX domain-containing protein [Paenibacillus sp. HWE-109]
MNKTEEMFDIYDENMNWLGAAPRSEVHAKGLWHQTFQCWIVTHEGGEPALLLQLRHPDKDLFPNLLDISCAGHLAAGETTKEGARELEEELGLKVNFDQLMPCGIFAEEDLISENLIDREFCHVFMHRCDQQLQAYVLQPDEVSGIFAVKAASFERLIRSEIEELTAKGYRLNAAGFLEEENLVVRLEQIVPHPTAYYELVFRKLREYGFIPQA